MENQFFLNYVIATSPLIYYDTNMDDKRKSKLSAVMFTDIVNYSRVMEDDENAALALPSVMYIETDLNTACQYNSN